MYLLDVNILLYAMRDLFPQHARAKAWLEEILSGTMEVVIPDFVEVAVVRIATHSRVFNPSLTVKQAEDFLKKVRSSPMVQSLAPISGWQKTFYHCCQEIKASGDDVSDCYLAALSMEADATLVSVDQGFARFKKLRWINPLD